MNGRRRRPSTLACVAFALGAAVPASAQNIPGVPSSDPGATSSSAAPTSAFSGSSGASSVQIPTTPLASPQQLFGLQQGDEMQIITLEDALRTATETSWDLRIAREKVVQQEAAVRRAWSMLLPQVSLSGNYTFSCSTTPNAPIFSDDERVRTFLDCRDVTVGFANNDSIDAQIAQLNALGTILEQVAQLENDPIRQQEIQGQADGLFAGADSIEDGREEALKPIVVQPAHVLGGSLNVSVPLFNGRAFPLLQNAYTAVDAVGQAGSQAREALQLAVSRAYYAAFTAKKLVQITQKQRDSAARQRDATRTRVELQTAPPLSLRRAELDVIRAEQSVRQAEAGYRAAIGAVGSLTGIDTYFDVTQPPPVALIESQGTPDELITRAMANRQDLRAQKLAVVIADRNKLDAWMMFLPSVNLVGQSRVTSNTSGFIDVPVSNALIVQANIPLYDGGARYASLKESSSRVREELMKVRQLEERIAGQVRGNIEDLRIRTQALALAREAVEVSRIGAEQAQVLFDAGAATSLDVAGTQLSLFVTEVELARTELDIEQARLGLAYVVGSLPVVEATPLRFDSGEQAAARAVVERSKGAP